MKNLGNLRKILMITITYSNNLISLNYYSWGVRTMLEAIISFLPSEGAGAIGALDWSRDERQALAREVSDNKLFLLHLFIIDSHIISVVQHVEISVHCYKRHQLILIILIQK